MSNDQENHERAGELLTAAIDGALAVLNDKEAPATSRASAVGSAIRLYELLAVDDPSTKQPSEMTADELQSQIAKLRKLHAAEA